MRNILRLSATMIAFGAIVAIGHIAPVFAQSADELRERIEETNGEIAALEEEIVQYENELEGVQGQKNTLAREIQRIDLTRQKLTADISLTEKRISVQEDEITTLSNSIEDKDDAISVERSSMASALRSLQENDGRSTIELLLSEQSVSDFWSEASELQTFYRQLAVHTQELQTLRTDLSATREEVEAEKRELENLRQQLAGQKRVADSQRAEKNQLLAATENEESRYQTLLEEKRQQREELEQAIFDYESQLEYILDPSAFPSGQYGLFSWPLEGNIYITQLFGHTAAAQRLYTDGSHSGVDFRAAVGTPVKAPAGGVIMGTGNTENKIRVTGRANVRTTPNGTLVGTQLNGALGTIIAEPVAAGGYYWSKIDFNSGADGWVASIGFDKCVSHGKWVVIDHQNGLATRFSHLSDIAVSEGQQVQRGEVFAYSGNTGYSTGPHLHISVNVAEAIEIVRLGDIVNHESTCADAYIPVSPKGAYLDPMEYLPEYN